ncbi:MAG: cytochrome b/b6 domain-containing protein [Sphingomicrobium sp.]
MSGAKQPVWDLPVRLFHWLLAGLICLSWWTAKNDALEIHLYSGYAILSLIIFRVLWGVFGSSTAQFRNFVHRPSAVIAYIRDGRAWKAIGHSPLSALSVLAILVVLKLQVATGLLNADDDGLTEGPLSAKVSQATVDFAHEAHDWLFKLLLTLIALHIAAILFYHLVQKKNLVGPMVTGKAEVDPAAEPMRPGKYWVALLCLAAAIATTRVLIALGG